MGKELDRRLELVKAGATTSQIDILAREKAPPPEICTEGALAKLTNGTLVVVVKGPAAMPKEKALKCESLVPIRVVGGRHEGRIGCVADSNLAQR